MAMGWRLRWRRDGDGDDGMAMVIGMATDGDCVVTEDGDPMAT